MSKGGVACEGSMDHLATMLLGNNILHKHVAVSCVVALSIYGSSSEAKCVEEAANQDVPY